MACFDERESCSRSWQLRPLLNQTRLIFILHKTGNSINTRMSLQFTTNPSKKLSSAPRLKLPIEGYKTRQFGPLQGPSPTWKFRVGFLPCLS